MLEIGLSLPNIGMILVEDFGVRDGKNKVPSPSKGEITPSIRSVKGS